EMPTETWGAVAFGGGILFDGLSSASGTEPWISDGTAAGTHVLKDVVPGPGSGLQSEIVAGGSTAYFVGGDSWHELWKTDGTEAGTTPILEMSSPYYVLVGQIDGTLYFFAYSADSYRWSLWRSDGTAAGTREVRSLGDGALSRDPVNRPVVSGSRVYFAHGEGDTRLFSSDGTHAGTLPLSLPVPRVDFSAVPGGVAFGWESGVGFTDGTPEGTRSLGTASPRLGRDRAESFVRLGSMILFSGWDADHGYELWRADLEGGGRMFYTVVPCRVVDTRIPEDGPPILDGATREITVAGRCGVPIDAAGVVLNATVAGSTGDGYIEVSPARRGPTGTRSTSFRAGQTRASSMVLGLDPASQGMVSVRLFAPGYADVILDVSGYFR
ncbi:MAG: hypothetical protein JNK60_05375, partial [Acidobacteria bacterium]|nr:hypothetical protein [Acidobacteriota bacterium]